MNEVHLIGRLTRDPEIRETRAGRRVANFTLAVDRYAGSGERATDFIRVIAWTRLADFTEKWVKKGSKVAVSGRLQSDEYVAQDGSHRERVQVVAREMEFAESKREPSGYEPDPDPNPSGYEPDDGCPF